jgi:hypothetical protein
VNSSIDSIDELCTLFCIVGPLDCRLERDACPRGL